MEVLKKLTVRVDPPPLQSVFRDFLCVYKKTGGFGPKYVGKIKMVERVLTSDLYSVCWLA